MKDDKDIEARTQDDRTPSAEGLQVAIPNSVPVPNPRRSSKKWLWITAGGIVLLVLIGVSTYLYSVALPTESKKPNLTDELSAATSFASPEKLVDQAKAGAKGTVMDATKIDGFGGEISDGYGAYGLPPYQIPGEKYATLPTKGVGAGYLGDSIQAGDNYVQFGNFFKANKFKLTDSANPDESFYSLPSGKDIPVTSYAVYESPNIICMIFHVDATSTPLSNHIASMGCADKNDYKPVVRAVEQLYAAYSKEQDKPIEGVIFGSPVGADGADGYKNASVDMEDATQFKDNESDTRFTGLYYQAPGQKDWTYFEGAHGALLNCSEYNETALKKAFKGKECYDENTQKDSIVQ